MAKGAGESILSQIGPNRYLFRVILVLRITVMQTIHYSHPEPIFDSSVKAGSKAKRSWFSVKKSQERMGHLRVRLPALPAFRYQGSGGRMVASGEVLFLCRLPGATVERRGAAGKLRGLSKIGVLYFP